MTAKGIEGAFYAENRWLSPKRESQDHHDLHIQFGAALRKAQAKAAGENVGQPIPLDEGTGLQVKLGEGDRPGAQALSGSARTTENNASAAYAQHEECTSGAPAGLAAIAEYRHDDSASEIAVAAQSIFLGPGLPFPAIPTLPISHAHGGVGWFDLQDRAEIAWAKSDAGELNLKFPAGMAIASLQVLAQAGQVEAINLVSSSGFEAQVLRDIARLHRRLTAKGMEAVNIQTASASDTPAQVKAR